MVLPELTGEVLDEDDWNFTVRTLADCGLVSVTEESSLAAVGEPRLVGRHGLVGARL